MAERHQDTASPASMFVPDFLYGSLFDSGRYALDRWTHAVFECNRELSAFAMARWQQEVEAWTALGNCRSFEELMQCQSGFLQKAASDYLAEAGKLVQVVMEATSAALGAGPTAAAPERQAWDVAPVASAPATPGPAPARARAAAPAHAGDKPANKRRG